MRHQRHAVGLEDLGRLEDLLGLAAQFIADQPVGERVSGQAEPERGSFQRAGEVAGGLGRGDALRQAKLALLKRTGRQHPFYWASFIQSGEWANLDGRR